MPDNSKVKFYHAPQTRSGGVLILLEELAADYELNVINMKGGEQRQAAYLAINPMGKVPAVTHNGALVTEQVAIYLYLADLYPEAKLAPPIGDPLRGPYLRWMAYYGSCFEPAVIDLSQKRAPAPQGMSPYGDFETMMKTLTDNLAKGDWMLGARFSALDVLWGTSLSWMTMFGLVEKIPVIEAYTARFNARPAVAKANAKDAELVAGQSQAEG